MFPDSLLTDCIQYTGPTSHHAPDVRSEPTSLCGKHAFVVYQITYNIVDNILYSLSPLFVHLYQALVGEYPAVSSISIATLQWSG